jgi:hypothetical protein
VLKELNYEFRSLEDRHDFSQAAAWEGDLGGFRCRLDQGTLEARPRAHYANVDSARHALERHLRAWELWSELNNIIRVEFLYKSAQVVDRRSTPDSVSVAVDAEAAEVVVVANDATVKLGHGEYPAPPSMDLVTSPLVEELLGWVRDLREGRQRMLVLTYLFFTRLKYEYNDEIHAAAALRVSRKVLVTLRKLAGKNDPSERRKVEGPIQRLTELSAAGSQPPCLDSRSKWQRLKLVPALRSSTWVLPISLACRRSHAPDGLPRPRRCKRGRDASPASGQAG